MKTTLIVLLISATIGFSIFIFLHNEPKTKITEFVLSTGNEPGPDPRPDE